MLTVGKGAPRKLLHLAISRAQCGGWLALAGLPVLMLTMRDNGATSGSPVGCTAAGLLLPFLDDFLDGNGSSLMSVDR
jgi:hypothetical protein